MSDKKIKLELYLVRHGESMSQAGLNDTLPPEIASDTPLSPKGHRQAELLGEYFSSFPLDHVISSPLRRAANTAFEIVSRQPENGARFAEVHKLFVECGTGEDTPGRTIEEIRKEFPPMAAAQGMKEDEKLIYYGRDDTDQQLLDRAKICIDYLLERFHNGEKVMVTAHAAFDTFLMFAALGLPAENKFDPSFFNTSITKIVFFNEGEGAFSDIHLEYHNAVPHLIGEFEEFRF